jgi:hypothetical protein
MANIVRSNPERTQFQAILEDSNTISDICNLDEDPAVIEDASGNKFLISFDGGDDILDPNTIYQLTPVETLAEIDDFETDDDDDQDEQDSVDEDEDEDEDESII